MSEFLCGALSGITQTIVGHPLDTIKTRIQNKNKIIWNVKNLYKGVPYPLLSSTLINAGLFGITERSYKITQNYYLSGFIAGSIMTPFIAPFELLKVREQNYCKKNIKLWRGFLPTLYRESIGTSIYFGTYFKTKEYTNNILFAGGFSGFLSWFFTYPIDSIKTRIQSDDTMTIKKAIKMRNFWAGFSACAVRCIIVNALGFYVYENSIEYMKD